MMALGHGWSSRHYLHHIIRPKNRSLRRQGDRTFIELLGGTAEAPD